MSEELVPALKAVEKQGTPFSLSSVESLADSIGRDPEINGEDAGGGQAMLDFGMLNGATASGQHELLGSIEKLDGAESFDMAEGWFTVLSEDSDDIGPKVGGNELVEVQKRKPIEGREVPADRGLT